MKIPGVFALVCGMGLACGWAEGGVAVRPPAEAQAFVDGMKQAAATNNWKGTRQEYDKVDWRKVEEPLPVLREMSAALKTNGSAEFSLPMGPHWGIVLTGC